MSVYSRAYLKSLPEKMRLDFIEKTIITYLYNNVRHEAINGKTLYRFPVSLLKQSHSNTVLMAHYINNQPPPELTVEELIPIIRTKFPDCKVFYDETWIDEVRGHEQAKYLSKSIVIDWT